MDKASTQQAYPAQGRLRMIPSMRTKGYAEYEKL